MQKIRFWVVEHEVSLRAPSYVLGKILSRHTKRIRAEDNLRKLAAGGKSLVVVKSETPRAVGAKCRFSDVVIEDLSGTTIPEVLRSLRNASRQLRGVILGNERNGHTTLVKLYRLILKLEGQINCNGDIANLGE